MLPHSIVAALSTMSIQEDLGSSVQVDGCRSSPVNIPKSHQHRYYVARSAPTTSRKITFRSPLVEPVLEESNVVVSSSAGSSCADGSMKPRKVVAELGDLSSAVARRYGATAATSTDGVAGGDGYVGGSIQIPHELEQSAEVAEDYVKIASRNKRAEHATT